METGRGNTGQIVTADVQLNA